MFVCWPLLTFILLQEATTSTLGDKKRTHPSADAEMVPIDGSFYLKKKYLSSILFPISLFIFRRFNVFYVHTLRVINTWHLLWILFFVAILCCTFHFNPTSRPVFFCCARKKKYSFKHSTNDTQNMVSFLSCSLHHIFAIIFVYVNLKNKKTRSRVEKQEIMKWKKTTKIHIHCARAMIDTYFNFVFHFDFLVSRILGCTVQHLTFRHD